MLYALNEKIREYEMLRQEILQFLEEYQNLRNMMYVITVTLLGFCLSNKNIVEYMYLLPLIVILPSYLTYIGYFNDIVRDAAYLTVFHESDINSPFKWESRLEQYSSVNPEKNGYRKIPYITCAIISILFYMFNMKRDIFNIVLETIVVVVCVYVFIKYDEIKPQESISIWEKVKEKENS